MKELDAFLKVLDGMLEVQQNSINKDPYMQGMYNGMEYARSLLMNMPPIFIDLDGEFDPDEMAEQPERFI